MGVRGCRTAIRADAKKATKPARSGRRLKTSETPRQATIPPATGSRASLSVDVLKERRMRKFVTLASLAVAAVGFSAITGGTAFAASNHYGHQYTTRAQFVQTNKARVTEQKLNADPAPAIVLSSHPNMANARARGNH